MRKIWTKIFLVMIALNSAVIIGGAFINYFHARSEGDDVILTWQTGAEVNVNSFIVERKTVNGVFTELSSIQPKGNNSDYTYVDKTAYKTTDAIYIYRIKILDNDNSSSYSSEISVSHSVSSVKRTWGSIKALFR